MKAQAAKDVQEIAYLKALLKCPSNKSSDQSGNVQLPKKDEELIDTKGMIFDKYVTNLTSTTLALKTELDEVKQELKEVKNSMYVQVNNTQMTKIQTSIC